MSLPTYDFTDAGLKQALEALGDSSETVAGNLTAWGFKGQQHLCEICPVANYLLAVIEAAEKAAVGPEYVRVYRTVVEYVDVRTEMAQAFTPLSVSAFVEDFDDRRYPTLIKEAKAA